MTTSYLISNSCPELRLQDTWSTTNVDHKTRSSPLSWLPKLQRYTSRLPDHIITSIMSLRDREEVRNAKINVPPVDILRKYCAYPCRLATVAWVLLQSHTTKAVPWSIRCRNGFSNAMGLIGSPSLHPHCSTCHPSLVPVPFPLLQLTDVDWR